MKSMRSESLRRIFLLFEFLLLSCALAADPPSPLRSQLDAPLLFVKRFNYQGIHIYDTYYKWIPGGGIYLILNPWAPPEERLIRPLIDATTDPTLGQGIYSDPELSYDGQRFLFCYKDHEQGSTCIYEMGVDGTGLRRLTDPSVHCSSYAGSGSGHHDVGPVYLPDGRILFTSTRMGGLVPCANLGVDILHVMGPNGEDIRPLSVNNVNEFDPCLLPDGRVLFGRWEYVDKTALTQQSLWTMLPDGTLETALFANNMVHPEAILDARPVPGSPDWIVGTFTPHNAPPRGSIALIQLYRGKNAPEAILNLEHPENPTFDQGESCEPWPLSLDTVLYSGRIDSHPYNALLLIDRTGRKELVHQDPDIDCHSPMLVKARPRPPILPCQTSREERTGTFFVQDIHKGLGGIEKGEIKWLRILEETSRTSGTPGGQFNQTFLISAILAFSAKNILGVVPVERDGSAFFKAPSGKALYFQALDKEGRLVQSMRTFVQAAPGTTRSCIGCHEEKYSASPHGPRTLAMRRSPSRPAPESWGSGFIDYASMVQPVLDRNCVRCHGGEDGIQGGMDLSGGWTEYFNISYENLVARRNTQLTAHWIAGIDTMNGTSAWSAQILPPRSHGSGAAPLGDLLTEGHQGHIPDLSKRERDLLMAWMDTNGVYYGTWDYTRHGFLNHGWSETKTRLLSVMGKAGCMECHGTDQGQPILFENDWINLKDPEKSRILRAPLRPGRDGHGLGLCRNRKADPRRERLRFLSTGHYLHGAMPLSSFPTLDWLPYDGSGQPIHSFESTENEHYREMLSLIQRGRRMALNCPRVDMPGAEVIPGSFRQLYPPIPPDISPTLCGSVDEDAGVRLSWSRTSELLGLSFEVHRSLDQDFQPASNTLLVDTPLFHFLDLEAPVGRVHYALLSRGSDRTSDPSYLSLNLPEPDAPRVPDRIHGRAVPGGIVLSWTDTKGEGDRYSVWRRATQEKDGFLLTPEPTFLLSLLDATTCEDTTYEYRVQTVSRRGILGPLSEPIQARCLPQIHDPVLSFEFGENPQAHHISGKTLSGKFHGQVQGKDIALRLQDGHVTFPYHDSLGLGQGLTLNLWVWLDEPGQIPVVISCGQWQVAGWFLQRLGDTWRWHVGGVDCDGGAAHVGIWIHMACVYDGSRILLYQDGKQVANNPSSPHTAPWRGDLHLGQYSAGPAPVYQTKGSILDLRIYHRVLSDDEILMKSKKRPVLEDF